MCESTLAILLFGALFIIVFSFRPETLHSHYRRTIQQIVNIVISNINNPKPLIIFPERHNSKFIISKQSLLIQNFHITKSTTLAPDRFNNIFIHIWFQSQFCKFQFDTRPTTVAPRFTRICLTIAVINRLSHNGLYLPYWVIVQFHINKNLPNISQIARERFVSSSMSKCMLCSPYFLSINADLG